MWDITSYRDLLSENTGRHHTVGSSLIILAAIGALIIVFA